MKYLIRFILSSGFLFILQFVHAQNLHIDSNPQGAKVSCDGKNIGTTPFRYEIKPENQILKFTHPDSIHTKTVNLKHITEDMYNFNTKTFFIDFTQSHKSLQNTVNRKNTVITIDPKIQRRDSILKTVRIRDSINYVFQIRERDTVRTRNRRFIYSHYNIISWQISAAFIKSIDFSYERRLNRESFLGINIGYKGNNDGNLHSYTNHNIFDINGPVKENMLMPFSESIYAGLNYKRHISKFLYVNGEIFSRSTKYDHVTIHWDDAKDKNVRGGEVHYSDSLRANINSYGFKATVGFRHIIPISQKIGFAYDVYAGLGARMQNLDLFHYKLVTDYSSGDAGTDTTEINKTQNYTSLQPSFHLGVKIGFVF